MCNKKGRREIIIKIIAIFVFLCFTECAAGSCLNYGHACWGAHGKRSDSSTRRLDKESLSNALNSKWFLSKLVQNPMDVRYFKETNFDSSKNGPDPLFSSDELDNFNGKELMSEDQLYDDNMLRLPKYLEKVAIKQN